MQYLLVQGYHRETEASYGRVTASHAVLDSQLSGVILRLFNSGSNIVVVTEISEEVFVAFYEEGNRSGRLKDEQ